MIKNVGYLDETLRMEPLTPFGGFSVLNALRTIKPGETKSIVIQFMPFSQQIYEEKLFIFSKHTVVSITLKGTGVRPECEISLADGLLSFGNVIVNESIEKSFSIKNLSGFPVDFDLVSKVSGVENKSHLKPSPWFLLKVPLNLLVNTQSRLCSNLIIPQTTILMSCLLIFPIR